MSAPIVERRVGSLSSGRRILPNRRGLERVARWLLGAGLLVLALRQVDPATIATALRSTRLEWLLIALVSVLVGVALKGLRWALLLRPVFPERSGYRIMGALLVGQAANILLPVRGGDLVRAGSVLPAGDGRLGAVLAGIAIEKAFDLVGLAATAALALPFLPHDGPSATWIVPLSLGLALLGGTLAAGLVSSRAWATLRPFLDGPPKGLRRRVQGWVDSLSRGLAQLSRSRGMPLVFGLTGVVWLVMLSTNLALLRALNMNMSDGAAIVVLAAVHLSLIPALMPGNFGPFYLAVEVALAGFGYAPDRALAYAVVLHALVTLIPLAGAGLYQVIPIGREARG